MQDWKENQDPRVRAVGEMAERVLHVATVKYNAAPKVILDPNDPDPPPLAWHASFTGCQVVEIMLRLLVLRKLQVSQPEAVATSKMQREILKAEGEANRILEVFNIQLAQEI